MLDNELIIEFTPSSEDEANVKKITDFLEEYEIPYTVSDKVYGLIHIRDSVRGNEIELRYISSAHYHMDNSKRFGPEHKGVPKNYFIDISHGNVEKNIRTIWIFDFEMNQSSDIYTMDGKQIKDYHRMWEVIKNTIRTATGHIKYRFFARDCEVCVVDNSEMRPFLDEHCFYGYRAANVCLGMRLKKDKNGFKKGDLLYIMSFGSCYYGNKNRQDDPITEVIRVSTRKYCQVIGGNSRLLKHFLMEYPTLTVGSGATQREVNVNEVKFYVDASHNDGRALAQSNYEFESWDGTGFMNVYLEDIDEYFERPDGKRIHIQGKKNCAGHRMPLAHKRIMELIKEKRMVSIGNAGTQVYHLYRDEYLKGLEKK